MNLKHVAAFSLAGVLLAGCSSNDGMNQTMHKLERGEPDIWNLDVVKEVPETQLPPDVQESFHKQYGESAKIARVEDRRYTQDNHYYRVYFEKSGQKGIMDYNVDGDSK
jgi:hypothetical protein